MICYGWGDVIRNKQFMGYQFCDNCCGFQQFYLSKIVFRVHISYIPIFWKTKGYCICCKSCKRGRTLTKQEFRDLKAEYRQMTKSQAKKCFKELCSMCDALGVCNEHNINYVMDTLAATYPITANETLRSHYREAVAMRLEMNEQMKRAQAQAQSHQIPAAAVASIPVASTTPVAPHATPQAGSWICSCGATNTTKFCADCGAQQPADPVRMTPMAAIQAQAPAQEAQPAAVTVCPRCGKENMNAPFFCSVCGSPMNAKH